MVSCFETRDRPEDIPLFSLLCTKLNWSFYIQKYYLVATAEILLEDSLTATFTNMEMQTCSSTVI